MHSSQNVRVTSRPGGILSQGNSRSLDRATRNPFDVDFRTNARGTTVGATRAARTKGHDYLPDYFAAEVAERNAAERLRRSVEERKPSVLRNSARGSVGAATGRVARKRPRVDPGRKSRGVPGSRFA